MVVTMCKQSPDFFKKFKNSFKFYICCTLPELVFSTTNDEFSYGFAKHETEDTCKYIIEFNTGCPFDFHILIEIEKLSNEQRKSITSELFNLPCPFTGIKELILSLKDYVAVGHIMEKLISAVL